MATTFKTFNSTQLENVEMSPFQNLNNTDPSEPLVDLNNKLFKLWVNRELLNCIRPIL